MPTTGCHWRAYDTWYREFREFANWDLATVLLAVRDVLHQRGLLKPDDDDRFERVAGEIAVRREPPPARLAPHGVPPRRVPK
jgi:hypothetical protein